MHFEEVATVAALPEPVNGPTAAAHIMRWPAAMHDRRRIPCDRHCATRRDGRPDALVNGTSFPSDGHES